MNHTALALLLVSYIYSQCAVMAQRFPNDLLNKVRFHHLQENFYIEKGEDLLRQAEVYMAQDLVDSIEELSIVVGVTSNTLYLPTDRITHFTLLRRIESKYRHISCPQLVMYLSQHAYRTFERQRTTPLSALLLDDLETEWLEWYRGVLTAIS